MQSCFSFTHSHAHDDEDAVQGAGLTHWGSIDYENTS